MKKITCIIADDEPLARDILQAYVGRLDGLELAAVCSNGAEVFNVLQQRTVDLLFLDIRMPFLTGMELLKTVRDLPPVILTTAYSDFAVESYGFNVVDYLLKPIAFERLVQSVQKYISREAGPAAATGAGIAAGSLPAVSEERGTASPFMYIRSDKKMVKVFYKDILFIEGLKDYVVIQLEGKSIITYMTLNALEEKLPETMFVRAHRSYIVSLGHISAYTSRLMEIGGKEIPIGDSYAKRVLAKLGG